MYRLKLDGGWLFNPDYPDYSIEKGSIDFEANKLATLRFTIYDSNPVYGEIKKLTSIITVYRDNEIIGVCRPMLSKLNFNGGVDYTCEDILARLNDVKKRPGYFTGTDGQYLQSLMNEFNTMIGQTDVIFELGRTPHSGSDATLEFFNDEYTGFWDLMQKNVIEQYGGYLRPVYSDGKVIIEYVGAEDLYTCGQTIRFGENLDSLFIETDSNETFSVLIPLGKDVTNPSAHGKMSKNTPLTIASVNSGLDYLVSEDGLAIYGRREHVERWNDIANATELKAKAEEYLRDNAITLSKKITLSAIDLRYAGVNVEYLGFLTNVLTQSKKHDLEAVYPLTKMSLSLNSPVASKIQLGDTQNTLTDQMSHNIDAMNGMYSSLNGRVFDLENPE